MEFPRVTVSVVTIPPTVESRPNEARSVVAGTEPRTIERARAIVSVIPRASPDEDAIRKPLRTIVAIGRASVRIISIISVCAYRRTHVRRADANAYYNPLRVSV